MTLIRSLLIGFISCMFISCSSTGMKSASSSYKKSNDGTVFKVKLSNKNTKRKPANLEMMGDNPKTLLNRIVRACQTNDLEYLGVAFHHFGDDSPEDYLNKSSSQSKDNFKTYLQTGSYPASNPSSCALFTEGLLDGAFLFFSKIEQPSDYFRPILNATNISSFDRGAFLNRIETKMQSCEPYMNYNTFSQVSKASRENRLSELKNSTETEAVKTLILEQETYSSSSQQAIDCTDYAIGAYTTIYVNEIAKVAVHAIAEGMAKATTEMLKGLGEAMGKVYETSINAATEVTIGLTEGMAKGVAEGLNKNPDQNK